jgi:hypothetical protein
MKYTRRTIQLSHSWSKNWLQLWDNNPLSVIESPKSKGKEIRHWVMDSIEKKKMRKTKGLAGMYKRGNDYIQVVNGDFRRTKF